MPAYTYMDKNLKGGKRMSISSSAPSPFTRSRWFEPIITAVIALLFGLAFSHITHDAIAPPRLPVEKFPVTAPHAKGSDLRILIGIAAKGRIDAPDDNHPQVIHIQWYEVQWGNTLSQIALQYRVSIAEIESANHLTGPQIKAGQRLVIPLTTRGRAVDRLETAKSSSIATTLSTAPRLGLPPSTLPSADILMLAHLIQGEAGNQPYLGQVAVAAVVLNRLRTPGFPKTLSGVIFQPGQFDSVSDGAYYAAPSAEALMAAQAAASGWDPTPGALYFFNPSLPHSAWMQTLKPDILIGQQEFCQ